MFGNILNTFLTIGSILGFSILKKKRSKMSWYQRVIIFIAGCILFILAIYGRRDDNKNITDALDFAKNISSSAKETASDTCQGEYKIEKKDSGNIFQTLSGSNTELDFLFSYISGDRDIGGTMNCIFEASGRTTNLPSLQRGTTKDIKIVVDFTGKFDPNVTCTISSGQIPCNQFNELMNKEFEIKQYSFSGIKVLGIDMSFPDWETIHKINKGSIENCDDYDFVPLREELEKIGINIKTVYSEIPCCNEKVPQVNFKKKGILFFNNENSKYITENGEKTYILESFITKIKKYYNYLDENILLYENNENELNDTIKKLRLSDCSAKGNCLTSSLGYSQLNTGSNLFSPNIFKFEKYIENKNIDFIFFLPFKEKGIKCNTGNITH